MAFAFVQASADAVDSVGTATTVNMTVSATGAGNLVVAVIRMASTSNTCTSVTDNVGNTYALVGPSDNSTNIRLYLAYGVQTTGGATTITANFTGSSATKRCFAGEFSGGESTNAAVFDASATANGTSTTPAVASITTAASGELIIGAANTNGSPGWTAGSGFTQFGSTSGGLRGEYKLSGGASETCPWTLGSSVAWAAIGAAFKPSGGGASVNSGFFRFM